MNKLDTFNIHFLYTKVKSLQHFVRLYTPHGISYPKTIMYALCHYHQKHRIGMIRFDVVLLP